MVQSVLLPAPHQRQRPHVRRIRPVRRRLAVLERALLAQQVLLRDVADGHVARVSGEARDVGRRGQVVVRRARVPDYEVAGLHADFFPREALGGEPGHAGGGDAVPFFGPVEFS